MSGSDEVLVPAHIALIGMTVVVSNKVEYWAREVATAPLSWTRINPFELGALFYGTNPRRLRQVLAQLRRTPGIVTTEEQSGWCTRASAWLSKAHDAVEERNALIHRQPVKMTFHSADGVTSMLGSARSRLGEDADWRGESLVGELSALLATLTECERQGGDLAVESLSFRTYVT